MLLLLAALAQESNLASVNQPSSSASIWGSPATAAAIGASSALLVSILKDYFFEKIKYNREKSRSDSDTFSMYLGPLSDSCEKLSWRLHEFFVKNRYEFLTSINSASIFNTYKRISTLYRIASLIGWVRGMEIELSSIAAHNPGYTPPIATQMSALRSALADGPSLEIERLKQICLILNIDISSIDSESVTHTGLLFELKAYEFFNDEGVYLSDAINIDESKKYRAVKRLTDFLCAKLNHAPIDDSIIREMLHDIVANLIFRKSLIYREWQDAIGDAMIARDPNSNRRFRIIGFAEFSDLITKTESPWFKVLSSSIDDINLSEPNPRDFRVLQLRKVAHAVAGMLIAIDKIGKPSPVTAATLSMAKRLLAATSDAHKAQSEPSGRLRS